MPRPNEMHKLLLQSVVCVALGVSAMAGKSQDPAKSADPARPVVPTSIQVNGSVNIPRISKAPTVDDFITMKPSAEWEGKMARVVDFTQRDPQDGAPAMQRTEAYLGYDDKNFYSIFVCFDQQPKSVRSRMARRDTIGPEDDEVQVYLDTFNDKRRSYGFMTNPRGIQFDYLWTEERAYDVSFDTVWQSAGKQTPQGWVALMAIPFKSMRFPRRPEQTWGLLLQRVVPRTNENLFWPKNTHKVSGRLNQEGLATGLKDISPGRNMQFIPYLAGRSFRAPDLRDPNNPRFGGATFRGDIGLDAKMVIKDAFVLDVAVNPDFSQVESDEPQVTANQRFEVFFPEKRPFFLENSDYFNTPIRLLFTRRIADPQIGLRLTGKKGPYKLAMLFADDQSPGRGAPDNDPLHGKRAQFGVFRATRDFFKQSSVGVLYTHRQFQDSFNRVGGLDTHLKFKDHWTLDGQSVISDTQELGSTRETTGTSHQGFLDYTGKNLEANTMYIDTSANFLTRTGFFRRPDIRRFSNDIFYTFRREKGIVTSHGPEVFTENIWDHSGLRLTQFANANYRVLLPRQTQIGVYINAGREQLRPKDFSALTANRDYRFGQRGIFFNTFFFKQLTVFSEVNRGVELNFVPAPGKPPFLADTDTIFFLATVKPIAPLTIDNTYLLTRLRDRATGQSAFNDHIIRSKWNYQFTRALSLRFIMQYHALLANPNFTSLSSDKGLNTDVLVTWLLNPGTAVYVGYNTNLANPTPVFLGPGQPLDRFVNDSRGVFVKASYLFRF